MYLLNLTCSPKISVFLFQEKGGGLQCMGANPRPCTCQANVLPLSYITRPHLSVLIYIGCNQLNGRAHTQHAQGHRFDLHYCKNKKFSALILDFYSKLFILQPIHCLQYLFNFLLEKLAEWGQLQSLRLTINHQNCIYLWIKQMEHEVMKFLFTVAVCMLSFGKLP